MKKFIILILMSGCINCMWSQTKKKQILLIGTFHFNNLGLDVAKVNTFDIMSAKSQVELENISNKIKKFGPDKIFVEFPYNEVDQLNEYYQKNKTSLTKKDERVQLAIRTALKLDHKKLYGIDYKDTQFPYDSLMTGMTQAKQIDLTKQIKEKIKEFEKSQNNKIANLSLTEILLDLNSTTSVESELQWYIGLLNKAGKIDNFVGAYLVSEWYKRNLYMYALIQKLTESTDDKIMVLLGASHCNMLRQFIKFDPQFEIVELKSILK